MDEILWAVCILCLSSQKSNLMFKRLDASTLPEDILSNTQPLPMMAHSAGSALWVVHADLYTLVWTVSVLSHCFSLS